MRVKVPEAEMLAPFYFDDTWYATKVVPSWTLSVQAVNLQLPTIFLKIADGRMVASYAWITAMKLALGVIEHGMTGRDTSILAASTLPHVVLSLCAAMGVYEVFSSVTAPVDAISTLLVSASFQAEPPSVDTSTVQVGMVQPPAVPVKMSDPPITVFAAVVAG